MVWKNGLSRPLMMAATLAGAAAAPLPEAVPEEELEDEPQAASASAAQGAPVRAVDDVVRLLLSGDLAAVRLARRAGRVLGEAIAQAVSLFNPRVVVVGGQLAHAEEQLFAGIRELVYQRSLPLATRNLLIVRSKLDRRAGLIGLALLLADTIFAPAQVELLLAQSA
jgi:predicted NBD/HSP70 family sugar kinase